MSFSPRMMIAAAAVASQACAAAPPPAEPVAAARTRDGFEALLARYDAARGDERARLAALVDRAAAQRYATVSRLYWHTDLDAARADARATGRPILSLRMLGRLDEDRSCANSRFFRVALYANRALSGWLRDRFVLHWSSERPVPRLTIDFGDGRTVETTIAGNSAHYVLDADGRVVDVLPGLMTPRAFRRELEGALAAGPDLAAYHRARLDAIAWAWGTLEVPGLARAGTTLDAAERLTVTKAMVERPVVRAARLGGAPGDEPADSARWPAIGAALLAARGDAGEILDAQSRALVVALAPTDWARPGTARGAADVDALIASFERAIVGDTGLNLTRTRAMIHAELARRAEAGDARAFDDVNAWVYASVFLTPAADPWLGIATPEVFTGLPGDGVTVRSAPRRASPRTASAAPSR